MSDVLLGIDTNEQRARSQAETVLDLFDPDDLEAYLIHNFVDNPEGASVMQVDAVHRAQEILEAEDIPVNFREGSGDPAASIVGTADAIDADAICIAGRRRSPAGKMLFGSVSQSVLLNTLRPVLICSENHEPTRPEERDLLIGIDSNEDRAVGQAETVVDLFSPEGSRAHLLHDFGSDSSAEAVADVPAVERAAEILSAADFSVEFRSGNGAPSSSIVDAADEIDAVAICVGGRKRSPAGKMLFGSVSQSVVLNTERPVLFSRSSP